MKLSNQFSSLGEAIQHFQSESAISTYRIAQLTGLDEGTLSKLKHGKTNPSLDTLERIANVLETKLSSIILLKEKYDELKTDA